LVCRLSTGHVKTHLPLTSSHCAHKRIIYKSLTFSKIVNCRANAKGPDNLDRKEGGKWRRHHQQIFSLLAKCFDLQFMKLTLKCHPSLTHSLSLSLSPTLAYSLTHGHHQHEYNFNLKLISFS